MNNHCTGTFRVFSILLLFSLMLTSMSGVTFAKSPFEHFEPNTGQQLGSLDEDLVIETHPLTGKIRFLGTTIENAIENRNAAPSLLSIGEPGEETARNFLRQHGASFGLNNPDDELVVKREWQSTLERNFVRFQQQYNGIPVLAGELNIQMDQAGNILSVNGKILPDIDIDPVPIISAEQSIAAAEEYLSSRSTPSVQYTVSSEPLLSIYSPILIATTPGPTKLVWSIDVIDGEFGHVIRTIFVNAHSGNIQNEINQRRQVFSFEVWDAQNTNTYGTKVCENDPEFCGSADSDERKAALYSQDVYNFFANYHNQNSIDNSGMPLISVVRYGSGDTYWTGDRAIFAPGWPRADDIVAHEFVHGFTDYSSGLFNWYQSGAIAESLSDLWGEVIDQLNGKGNDVDGVKWLIGEDLPSELRNGQAALRNMKNPQQFGQPDKMTSPLYDTGNVDNGGIHTNSGVNNKAATLMVEGGTFNNYAIEGIGLAKTIAIYFEAQVNYLLSGSDYLDLHDTLYQACRGMEGTKPYQATSIITASDCRQVRFATLAVEMDKQPVTEYNPKAPLLDPGKFVLVHYREDWENGYDDWIVEGSGWEFDGSVFYAHLGKNTFSGIHAFYANDSYSNVDSYLSMKTGITVPEKAYLVFYHHYDLEYQKDGGLLEYSIDNGSSWISAESLIDYNEYDAKIISSQSTLFDQKVFTGRSNGYISTRLNLASLAGKNVRIRWRFATNNSGSQLGWWLDDILIYTERSHIFTDVTTPPWREYAETLYLNGITGGCSLSPLMYCPNSFVTRAQMAVFLLRAKYGKDYSPPPAQHIFSDVTPNSFFEPWIEQMAADGITAGCGANIFCPDHPVNRAQMAIFMLRTRYGQEYTPPAYTGIFADVPSSFFAPYIEQLSRDGVTGGCSMQPLLYCPNGNVTRGQMAIFLSRMFNLQYPQ